MSRFASPIAPGQLAGPDPSTQNAIRGAGQFAQQNQDRAEGARQANMQNATQRAGMAQEGQLSRDRMQFEGQQGDLQRQHEMGMQGQQNDAQMKLEADRQAFEKSQNDENRKLQRELEGKAREASNRRAILEQKAMLAPLEAKASVRGEVQRAYEEEMSFQTALSQAVIDVETGGRAVGERKTDLLEHLSTGRMMAKKFEAGGMNAAKMALATYLLDAADLNELGVSVDEIGGLESVMEKAGDMIPAAWPFREDGGPLANRGLGLMDEGTGYGGMGPRIDVQADLEAVDVKLRKGIIENSLRALRSSGVAPDAMDADVVDAVTQIVERARTLKNLHSAGTPAEMSELLPLIQKIGAKVPETALYSLFDNLGQMAEAKAIELKGKTLGKAQGSGDVGSYASPESPLENVRTALQLRGLEQFAGIDHVFNSALRNKIMRSDAYARLEQQLTGRTTPDQLDAEDFGALPGLMGQDADEQDLFRSMLADPRAQAVTAAAETQKGRTAGLNRMKLDAPQRANRRATQVDGLENQAMLEAMRKLQAEMEATLVD